MSRTGTSTSAPSLAGRVLKAALVLAVLFGVAFTVGQLMLASHMDDETRYLIAGAAAIAAVFLCFGRDRR